MIFEWIFSCIWSGHGGLQGRGVAICTIWAGLGWAGLGWAEMCCSGDHFCMWLRFVLEIENCLGYDDLVCFDLIYGFLSFCSGDWMNSIGGCVQHFSFFPS
jgi:hypothetical protein